MIILALAMHKNVIKVDYRFAYEHNKPHKDTWCIKETE